MWTKPYLHVVLPREHCLIYKAPYANLVLSTRRNIAQLLDYCTDEDFKPIFRENNCPRMAIYTGQLN